MNIKKGDRVVVIAGKDVDKKGKVLRVIPTANKVVVQGVNFISRHTRPTQELPQGGIIKNEAPLDRSNVQLICPRCGKNTRIGVRFLDDKKKVRVCRKCDEVIDK